MEENFRSDGAIVTAADRFIQKNKLRHKKNMKASRDMAKDIRLIEVKTRKSQYSYLTKVAENCNVDTAVLYRDNESIIPVVDMLERSGIDYKIKNADLTFFNHKIVTDIKNIIRFAENPKDTEIFMQIYFKIGTYLSKMGAIEACRISEEKGIPVIDSALRYGRIPKGTEKSLKAMKTHIESILEESAYKAVYRIVNFMGYSAYLERAKIKDGKISILQALAANEKTPEDFLNRLDELAMIIKNKKNNYDCKFTLSTIHSSKGLEYDTVYIMDVKDGVFPEKVVANRKKATDEEIKTYEEERRLYYVAVTRAKNQLCIFDFKDSSTFNNQLLGINVKSSADKTKFQKSGKKGIIATDRKTSKAIEMLRSKSYLR
jgi:DNA helicase-2/ATP-dependent DNA helicase PcrA